MGKFYEALYEGLSLYVRQVAWLNAVPEKPKSAKNAKPEISRRERLRQDGVEDPAMPECDGIHILGWLFEIGPALPNGMGECPLTHVEIAAWQSNTGIQLDAWEVVFLHRLSHAYLYESQLAVQRDREAPWLAAPYFSRPPGKVAAELKAALRGMAGLR